MSKANSRSGYCDGISRRRAIKIGGTGLLGGFSLPHLLAMADRAPLATPAKAKACIFLLIEGGPSRVSPFFIPMYIADMAAGMIAMRYAAQGPNYATVSACASGAHAIGMAFRSVRDDEADIMI
ncbi:MAG: beta-ketoacyl synthase N-terminal-like domain-containing protein, partial [Pirellulales bacterium]